MQKIVDNREVRVQSGLLLGTVLDGTAKYFSNLKDFEASIAVLQKAIAVRQSLVDEFPAEFQFSRALAKSFVGLSGALQSMGNLEDAIAQSEVAKPIYVDLLRRRPEDDDTRVQIITLLLNRS